MRMLQAVIIRTFFIASIGIGTVLAEDAPIFDAHIHYSHDAWDYLSPEEAIKRLRQAGIQHALVSSSDDDGTQKMFQQDPQRVIPSLRPYRKRGDMYTWMNDETVLPYLKSRLAKYHYVAIGEFHLDNAQADLPIVREVVKLARQHKLMLHVHADANAVKRILMQDPDAHIVWAHAGFEPAATIEEMMDRYPNVSADLSFRREIFHAGKFMAAWRELLIKHQHRFMLGVDTYTPSRWDHVDLEVSWARQMLASLPEQAARNIGYENGNKLIVERFRKQIR